MTLRVAVIGAGIVGVCVAAEFQRRGAQVVLWDRTAPGQGTSATTFAWTNAHAKVPRAYFELNRQGSLAHEALQRRTAPAPPWYVRSGNLVWAGPDEEDELGERIRRHVEWGGEAQWLSRKDVSDLEPDLRVPRDVDQVALFADEGYVIPSRLIGAMLSTARNHGAEFLFGEEVTGFTVDDLVTVEGRSQRRRVDRVIVCAGRWTDQVRALYGGSDPIMVTPDVGGPAVGMVAVTNPFPTSLNHVVTSPSLDIRPAGDGSLLLHASEIDRHVEPYARYTPDHALASEFLHRLDKVVVTHGASRLREIQVGLRALPRDGRTVAGPSPTDPHFYEVSTHSGVTLAALLGRLVASEILDEREQSLLTEFRPGRPSLGTMLPGKVLGPGGQ